MSEAAFPVNDLLRRRLQTGLIILSLTATVASTLFLLVFSSQIGFGIAASAQHALTAGTSRVLSQFLTFVGILIFVVGAVVVSFIVYLMMAQRTRDFGLMKTTGCPNSLVFGYFMTELLGMTFVGCVLGVIVGYVVDLVVINMGVFRVYSGAFNLWLVALVFAAFFAFALIFGAKPLLNAANMSPLKAISSVQYFGLSKSTFKPLSRTSLTVRIASRSLFRKKNTSVRITVFISVVFMLLTFSIAGATIANDTSTGWIRKSVGENVVLIANQEMANQYKQLLLSFSEGGTVGEFNYFDSKLAIPGSLFAELSQIQGVNVVDSRLVLQYIIKEEPSFTVDPETQATFPLGGHRQMNALVVGLDPSNLVSLPSVEGHFLNSTSGSQAVVGDSVAQSIYSPFTGGGAFGRSTVQADPLRERLTAVNKSFPIVGVCLDPLNNGNVVYVPISVLENATGISSPNLLLVKIGSSLSYPSVIDQINAFVSEYPNFVALDLNGILEKNTSFLSSIWNVILFLPVFTLASATLCLISFLMLNIEEQRQEFGMLRATGAKPQVIIFGLAIQSLVILLASFGVGTSIGTILCVLFLMANPTVSAVTVVVICAWLLAALMNMFLISLYPAVQFSRKSLLKIIS